MNAKYKSFLDSQSESEGVFVCLFANDHDVNVVDEDDGDDDKTSDHSLSFHCH